MKQQIDMVDTINNRTPKLRFPGFSGEWKEHSLGDSFLERVEKNRSDLPLLSLGEEGLVYQSETDRKDNSNADKSKYLRVAIGDIAYNTMRMWQGRCVCAGIEGIVSPAYTVCVPKPGIDSSFHYYLFKTERMIQTFHQHSQGLVSDTLNLKYEAFSKIKYLLPPTFAEQRKIAECLSAIDEIIEAQKQKVEAMKAHKKGLMQQLFPQNGEISPRLRFPDFVGKWEEKPFGEICTKITPPIKLQSSEYLQNGLYPIVDQSQKLICGWTNDRAGLVSDTPVIIFGDHTCILKYIDFPFIQGADGVKILSVKDYFDPQFVFQSFQSNPVKQSGYKRHFSDFKEKTYFFPSPKEQKKVGVFLSKMDELIGTEQEKLDALQAHKKGLMQQLFPNR